MTLIGWLLILLGVGLQVVVPLNPGLVGPGTLAGFPAQVFMIFLGVLVLWAGYLAVCKGQVGPFADRLDAEGGGADGGEGGAS